MCGNLAGRLATPDSSNTSGQSWTSSPTPAFSAPHPRRSEPLGAARVAGAAQQRWMPPAPRPCARRTLEMKAEKVAEPVTAPGMAGLLRTVCTVNSAPGSP